MYFAYSHAPIDCHFAYNPRDFVVNELPLYEFSGHGEHHILHIRKKHLSTLELISLLSRYLHIPKHHIGYAGLKDKNATTTQYISIPASSSLTSKLHALEQDHPIKILSITCHTHKLRMGHLRGNRFFIRLKKLNQANAYKLESILRHIQQTGFPNFFGFQRFGIQGDNYLIGWDISTKNANKRYMPNAPQAHIPNALSHPTLSPYCLLVAHLHPRFLHLSPPSTPKHIAHNRSLRALLLSSFQSFLFNAWLEARLEISLWLREKPKDLARTIKHFCNHNPMQLLHDANSHNITSTWTSTHQHACIAYLCAMFLASINTPLLPSSHPLALLPGDICCHYPYGKLFHLAHITQEESTRFTQAAIAPTGALWGKNYKVAQSLAGALESYFLAYINAPSARRYAWVWASDIEFHYKSHIAQGELHFTLPSGAYATSFLEQLLKRPLSHTISNKEHS